MFRRTFVCLLVLGAACSRVPVSDDPSPEDYCRQRDEAWVRAFPEEAKTTPGFAHSDSCPGVIRREQTNESEFWRRRVRCMREHIRTNQEGKAATDAYNAMTACERGDPQPVSK